MKFFRLDLLTLLISLFILNSCKNESSIGIAPAVQAAGDIIIDTNVVINTIPEDSIVTTGVAKAPLAYFQDPVLGTTEANIISLLNLPGSTAFTLPDGSTTVDSAVLVLPYAQGFYGDSISTRYKVNVYQLNSRYSTSTTYYNTHSWTYDQTSLLGTKQFLVHPHDSVKIYNIITSAPDTLHNVGPQIRIPLNKAFFQTALFNSSSLYIKSNPLFQNYVKGLYITVDKAGTTGVGGAIMLNLDSARVDVFYQTNTGTIDTTYASLFLGSYNTQIKHTYSAAVNAELANTTKPGKTFYIQGLLGLRAKVSFPDLQTLYNQMGGKMVINRAELVITPVSGTTIPFVPLPKISMYKLDIAKQRSVLEDANTSSSISGGVTTFGGYYNRTQNEYHFIVTGYVQDLMNGYTKDYGTYLGAVDTTNTTTVDIAATQAVAARTVAVGNDPTSQYRIKLNILYTKTAR